MGIFSSFKNQSISNEEGSAPTESNSLTSFKNQPLSVRIEQYETISKCNPTKVPVILERAPNSSVPEIDKSKYLVPKELTVAQFLFLIRKRIQLSNDQALFIYLNGQVPAASAIFSSLYEEHKNEDGFLYVVYTGESCFGGL